MISKKYICDNLSSIERLYSNSRGKKKPLLFAKLYLLELCGWIEDTFDELFYKCVTKNAKSTENKEYLEQMIDKIYGFSYEQHFIKMLLPIIGCLNLEKVEKRISFDKKEKFRLALNNLEEQRNKEAHSCLKKLRNIHAPSKAKDLFNDIYAGLIEYEKQLKRYRIIN